MSGASLPMSNRWIDGAKNLRLGLREVVGPIHWPGCGCFTGPQTTLSRTPDRLYRKKHQPSPRLAMY